MLPVAYALSLQSVVHTCNTADRERCSEGEDHYESSEHSMPPMKVKSKTSHKVL